MTDLFDIATRKHTEAMRAFHGNPNGSYGGSVSSEEDGIQVTLRASSFGDFTILIDDDNDTLRRLDWGPPGRFYPRQLDDREWIPFEFSDADADALGQLIAARTFSAGERRTASACSLCSEPPVAQDTFGEYALCDLHYRQWLDPDVGRGWGFMQFILREQGRWPVET
jgi:hypothetical protein